MPKKKTFYAVAKGRNPGIYTEWSGPNGAQVQVTRFKGASHQRFGTEEEAKAFIENSAPQVSSPQGTGGRNGKSDNKDKPSAHESERINQITIYTDGGCINNPGPGGYGAVIINGETAQEISGGYRYTTNNRMELMACIVALSSLKKPASVTLHSDSKYVVDGITKGWAKGWRANNWIKPSNKKPALNPDLWDQLLKLCEKHDVEFKWVKGHAGIEFNERCDVLATEAAQKNPQAADKVYEETDRSGK